jgi:hypothetical protein
MCVQLLLMMTLRKGWHAKGRSRVKESYEASEEESHGSSECVKDRKEIPRGLFGMEKRMKERRRRLAGFVYSLLLRSDSIAPFF